MSERDDSAPRRSLWVLVGVAVLALAGGGAAGYFLGAAVRSEPSSPVPSDAAVKVSQQWAKSWSAKDLEGALDLYADDAAFLPSIGGRIEGKVAIRKLLAGALEVNTPDLHLISRKSGQSGVLAFDSGDYQETLVTPSGKQRIQGSYLVVFQQDERGAWRIIQHMWTDVRPQGS